MTSTTSTTAPESPLPALGGATPERRRRLRRGLIAYTGSFTALAISLVLLARAQGADIDHLDEVSILGQLALFGAAFVPIIAMLAAWLASGVGPDWGLRRAPIRLLAVAWAVPVFAAVLTYVPAWLTEVAGFDADGMHDSFGGLPLPVALLVALGPGLVPWILLALGEELGWSSWFVVRLAELWDRHVLVLVYGVLWGLGHVPMMLLIPGAVPDGIPSWFAITMFLVETTALAYPMVWLRLESRSIWPVLVLHAALNTSIYFVGDLLTVDGEATDWFLGEGALLTAVATASAVLLTAPWWRRTAR
jgi:membrane protease YdiL (CAAX protease family)